MGEAEPVSGAPEHAQAHLPGGRVRQLRLQQGLGVRGLALAAGVSPANVSQIERGINDPSLTTLRKLAGVLGVPLFDLFDETPPAELVVQRAHEVIEVATPHHELVFLRLTPPNRALEMLGATLQPYAVSSEEPHGHPSREAVLVQAGELDLEVGGVVHRLGLGDSCQFDSRIPHRYLNPTPGEVRFLLSVTPPSY